MSQRAGLAIDKAAAKEHLFPVTENIGTRGNMNNGVFGGAELARIGAPEILDAIADGAYITDCNRRIVFWSQAAERITGWPANEVVGHSCSENILVHVDKDGHQLCGYEYCPLHRAISTSQVSSEPLLVFAKHREGHRVPVEVSVAPLRDRQGNTLGGVEIFRDLTDVMEDLYRAKVIQEHALESRLPEDARLTIRVSYSPEEVVGGDFYRIEAIGEDTYVIMVADVMGHGVASALYTMQLRSLWEECRPDVASPARFLAQLNRRLYRFTSPDGYFATAILLLLNAATGELTYVRAGHPAPMLFRKDGRLERFFEGSPALGLIEEAAYRETMAHLEPGDELLVFTDGAIEIVDAKGDELGEEGLLRIIRVLGTAGLDLELIERRLLEYTQTLRLPDDLTLVRVRRNR